MEVQPLSELTDTVYSVVVVGDTVRIELVPPPFQLKVEPPLAIKTTSSPAQIVPSLFTNPDLSVMTTKASFADVTVIVPLALKLPQPPVRGIL
jgi:hypothetical protein